MAYTWPRSVEMVISGYTSHARLPAPSVQEPGLSVPGEEESYGFSMTPSSPSQGLTGQFYDSPVMERQRGGNERVGDERGGR